VTTPDNVGRYRNVGRSLQFYNQGSGTARQIQIFVNGKPISEDGRIAFRSAAFETLGPGAVANVLATATIGTDPVYRLRITWEDESGREGIWESDLNG
jgi:hypothetical protein